MREKWTKASTPVATNLIYIILIYIKKKIPKKGTDYSLHHSFLIVTKRRRTPLPKP